MGVNTSFAAPPASVSEPVAVSQAVVRTVAYADVFDFPLQAGEVHRFLHGIGANREVTAFALAQCSAPGGPLGHQDGFYALRGREHTVELRRTRADQAQRLWPAAVWYGRLIARLPFVRMVAVTGSLAWDNVNGSGDIDYLVVTEPDRLWVTRWLIAAIVRLARFGKVPLCANTVISERAMAISEHNLYASYELARMKPVAGLDTYRQIRAANPWVQAFLPNASPAERLVDAMQMSPPARAVRAALLVRVARLLGPVLRSRAGAVLEWAEMRYRIRKRTLQEAGLPGTESVYGLDCFRDHSTPHQRSTLNAFAERLERLGAGAP